MNKANRLNSLAATILVFLIAGFMIQLHTSCKSDPPAHSKAKQAERGKALYEKHCQTCHSKEGEIAKLDTLSITPPDLSQIVQRRGGGSFPVVEIAQIIDGRQWVKSHGPRPMPVWGDIFVQEEELSEDELRGKLGELIAYLMSIQE